MINEQEQKKLHSFIIDFYNLMKAYWEPEDSDAFWDKLVEDVKVISDKYESDRLFDVLMCKFMQELEERSADKWQK